MGNKAGGVKLQIENVEKKFQSSPVLSNISLNAGAGEFIAIVGKSGCGKSTLLRLVAGLDKTSSGSIRVDSRQVAGIQKTTRVLFQDSRLLPWKKVIDNVQIGSASKSRQPALETLQQVGLEEKADVWPSMLSGGQRQRVALARALVGSPQLLLLDEPLGALDALTRIEMQQLLEDIWMEQQFTVMLVTHDVSEAVALADRVIVIENGIIGLDVRITLPRPREKDSGFAHFEKLILERLLTKKTKRSADLQYSI
ncbi:ATP-binding cassette domain-containing protein [Paenibacillus eucommiae]|uniref:Sulfonate transport system ATP-binding protein n=1 Tax=Paenibacillus eucommiae TaxID=1355755 RepID=A0ABS4J3I3_9BACL|nr:ATP-binding cassette domain-containing protein [Paenibacillus eucommiae]MBP1994402.1 sulfonate transport system ATP-binding protein [Paenibacillus eucommiae]